MIKKIFAVGMMGFSLLACNKNEKKTTNTADKKDEIVTSENVEQPTKMEMLKLAISDSAGIFTQRFILEKGQTYPLITQTKNTQTITDPTGKTVSVKSESIDEMSFTVDNIENEVYDISVNLLGKKTSESAQGQTVVVDTKAEAPKDENLKMMWRVNKTLMGNKLQMKMKENGEIISISGFEAIYKKINEIISGKIKDANQKQAFISGFKESFGEKSMKEQFHKNLLIIPKKGVKEGEKWTETENASPDGKVKLTTNYTLRSVDNGQVLISVTGGIPKQSDKKTQEGLTHSISSELNQSGTMTLDQKTGWIKNQSVTIKTIQTESITDGKQTQSMKNVGTSVISVNP